jgi:hypothetical protein
MPQHGFLFGDEKGPWSTKIQTMAFVHESIARMGFRVTTADYHHVSIAIDWKFIRGQDGEIEEEDEEDDCHDLMSSHNSRTANAWYGRDGGLLHQLSAHSIDVFSGISDQWQRWLGLIPRVRVNEGEKEERIDEVEEAIPLDLQLNEGMRQLFGEEKEFKSQEQRDGVVAMLEGVSPLVAIMATGGGKTLLITLPAVLKGAKTIVVVTPLIALANDLKKRCEDAGIDCIQWSRSCQRRATIVVIVTETATTKEFGQYVVDLYLSNRLDRIIFDEAQKLVTDRKYRPKLDELKRLAIGCQFGFLSGTLPPTMEGDLEKVMALGKPKYIRGQTNRGNFRYSAIVHGGDLEEEGVWRVEEAKSDLHANGKIQVFCTSKK